MDVIELIKQFGLTGISGVLLWMYLQKDKQLQEINQKRIDDYKWWLEILKGARITIVRQDSDSPTVDEYPKKLKN